MLETDSILLVEDDEIDQECIRRAFKDLKIVNPLHVVENGKEALDFILSPTQQTPCLILLDLNMPQMNGVEFLEVRTHQEEIKKIPVVVMTTSQEESDLIASYKLGVAGYLKKPVDYKEFVNVVHTIHLYWLMCLTPPAAKKKGPAHVS